MSGKMCLWHGGKKVQRCFSRQWQIPRVEVFTRVLSIQILQIWSGLYRTAFICNRRVRRTLTSDRPEYREVSAVADTWGVSEAIFPQVGPKPGHLDDEGASSAAYLGHPPVVHGHGAEHKHPSQGRDQEARQLDLTLPHGSGSEWMSLRTNFRAPSMACNRTGVLAHPLTLTSLVDAGC